MYMECIYEGFPVVSFSLIRIGCKAIPSIIGKDTVILNLQMDLPCCARQFKKITSRERFWKKSSCDVGELINVRLLVRPRHRMTNVVKKGHCKYEVVNYYVIKSLELFIKIMS